MQQQTGIPSSYMPYQPGEFSTYQLPADLMATALAGQEQFYQTQMKEFDRTLQGYSEPDSLAAQEYLKEMNDLREQVIGAYEEGDGIRDGNAALANATRKIKKDFTSGLPFYLQSNYKAATEDLKAQKERYEKGELSQASYARAKHEAMNFSTKKDDGTFASYSGFTRPKQLRFEEFQAEFLKNLGSEKQIYWDKPFTDAYGKIHYRTSTNEVISAEKIQRDLADAWVNATKDTGQYQDKFLSLYGFDANRIKEGIDSQLLSTQQIVAELENMTPQQYRKEAADKGRSLTLKEAKQLLKLELTSAKLMHEQRKVMAESINKYVDPVTGEITDEESALYEISMVGGEELARSEGKMLARPYASKSAKDIWEGSERIQNSLEYEIAKYRKQKQIDDLPIEVHGMTGTYKLDPVTGETVFDVKEALKNSNQALSTIKQTSLELMKKAFPENTSAHRSKRLQYEKDFKKGVFSNFLNDEDVPDDIKADILKQSRSYHSAEMTKNYANARLQAARESVRLPEILASRPAAEEEYFTKLESLGYDTSNLRQKNISAYEAHQDFKKLAGIARKARNAKTIEEAVNYIMRNNAFYILKESVIGLFDEHRTLKKEEQSRRDKAVNEVLNEVQKINEQIQGVYPSFSSEDRRKMQSYSYDLSRATKKMNENLSNFGTEKTWKTNTHAPGDEDNTTALLRYYSNEAFIGSHRVYAPGLQNEEQLGKETLTELMERLEPSTSYEIGPAELSDKIEFTAGAAYENSVNVVRTLIYNGQAVEVFFPVNQNSGTTNQMLQYTNSPSFRGDVIINTLDSDIMNRENSLTNYNLFGDDSKAVLVTHKNGENVFSVKNPKTGLRREFSRSKGNIGRLQQILGTIDFYREQGYEMENITNTLFDNEIQ